MRLQRPAGARQSGHDGADGDAQRIGNLAVRHLFELAEPDQLAAARRQGTKRPFETPRGVDLEQPCLRAGSRTLVVVLPLVEEVRRLPQALRQPAAAGVADDSQKPGPAVPAREAPEVAK